MLRWFHGIVWVAGVYFYFLIFAQFSFLDLLAGREFSAGTLKLVMGAMALGGMAGSFSVLLLEKRVSWPTMLRVAAGVCAVLPVLALRLEGVLGFAFLSMLLGFALGVLTVLLAANLPGIMGSRVYLGAGIGTGLAYMLSNVPWVFQASPEVRSYCTAACVLLLAVIPLKKGGGEFVSEGSPWRFRHFFTGVLSLMMLVWLDSAAFYIIQHNHEMKLATWGEPYLWRNAIVHLVFAVMAGYLLLRGKIVYVLGVSFLLLGVAGLMASVQELMSLAGVLYPAGVSLYSVTLILYPAVWLGEQGATRRAAVLFAIAGWGGSAMGIGMAQDLHAVPGLFVVLAGAVIIAPWCWRRLRHRKLELAVCAVVGGGCVLWVLSQQKAVPSEQQDPVAYGREVYLSEGCIHCHSRYVRPDTRDVLLWGPARPIAEITDESPVIIGNRRQGPDLLQVGLRRSKGWMKQHFLEPRSLVHRSAMPSYAYLFEDARGDALVAYLASYDSGDLSKRWKEIVQWTLPSGVISTGEGGALFARHCVMCHGAQGRGDGRFAQLWQKPPANLVEGPFAFTSADDGGAMLARVIKFGIPGTDMPGHELLSDTEIKTLADYVSALRKQ